jgi:hypothetical protein
MYFEVTSKRVVVDPKGNDKEISERFIVKDVELFGEAEMKTLQEFNGENDVVAIKQSKIREFVNEKNEEQDENIYLATIVSVFVDESNGNERETQYVVGLWATSTENATKIAVDYMSQGFSDLVLVGIKRTNFVDII